MFLSPSELDAAYPPALPTIPDNCAKTLRFTALAVDEQTACCVLKDCKGQKKLAYVYFEKEPGRRSTAKPLAKDNARRIAVDFAKLPAIAKAKPSRR